MMKILKYAILAVLLAAGLGTGTARAEAAAPTPMIALDWCQDGVNNHFSVTWDGVRVTNGLLVAYVSLGDIAGQQSFSVKGTRHGDVSIDLPGGTMPTMVDVNLMAGHKLTTRTFILPSSAPQCAQ